MIGPRVCSCHGETMLWQKDKRMLAGGRWECRAKRREYNRRRNEQRTAWIRDKCAADPIFRHERLEANSRRRRAGSLARRKQETPLNPRMAAFLKAVRPLPEGG